MTTAVVVEVCDGPHSLGTEVPAELESAVDDDITAFDRYFQQTLQNEPLTRGERAIIKTYLYYKVTNLARTPV